MANKTLSVVTVYLAGRSPFLSSIAPALMPSEKATAAGPSHGSINAELYSKNALTSLPMWYFEPHACGISISIAWHKSLPLATSSSNILSRDAESLASETGVLDIPEDKVLKKGRLRPGEIIYCDLENHRIIYDAAVKKTAARNLPYRLVT